MYDTYRSAFPGVQSIIVNALFSGECFLSKDPLILGLWSTEIERVEFDVGGRRYFLCGRLVAEYRSPEVGEKSLVFYGFDSYDFASKERLSMENLNALDDMYCSIFLSAVHSMPGMVKKFSSSFKQIFRLSGEYIYDPWLDFSVMMPITFYRDHMEGELDDVALVRAAVKKTSTLLQLVEVGYHIGRMLKLFGRELTTTAAQLLAEERLDRKLLERS